VADLSEGQRRRAEARERRRHQSASQEPDVADDDSAKQSGATEHQHEAVKHAAKVAAAGAAVGAAAAAARALTSHREDEDADEPERTEDDRAAPREAEETRPDVHERARSDGAPAPEAAEEAEPSDEEEEEQEEQEEPVQGAELDDARGTVERARKHLEALLERPVESVSALERKHDGWLVSLEVVEVRRIPESTDVLASYEVNLDDDLNLRGYQRVRRYHRAQADLGDEQ
jgi:hypothetical protein